MPSIFVPLLSDQSLSLVRNRLIETLTGGLTFSFTTQLRVSKWAYVIQIFVHQLPFIIGVIFTALVETSISSLLFASLLCALTMAVLTFVMQLAVLRWNVITVDQPSYQQEKQVKIKNRSEISSSPDQQLSTDEILAHIFPKKKCAVNYLLHPLGVGLLTGYGVVYFLPSTMYLLYRQMFVSYTIFVLGWQTICIAAFSLTAHPPPETATFRIIDRFELKPLMRPFYIFLCYLVDLFCRLNIAFDDISNAVVHLFLTFFSLLLFLNVFPPLDALFLWILEQIQVSLAGGSPSATKNVTCLLLQLLIWSAFLTVVFFLPQNIALLLCTIFGYVISLDIVNLRRSCCCLSGRRQWDVYELIFFGALLTTVTFLSLLLYFLISPNSFQLQDHVIFVFGVALTSLYVVKVITTSSQNVYFLCGFVRNCLYPQNSRDSRAAKRLQPLALIHNTIMTSVAPLVIIVYVTLTENIKLEEKGSKSWFVHLFRCIAIIRAYRWTWQQTDSALVELVISFFLIRYTRVLNVLGCSAVVYLLASFLWDRLLSVKSKCHMILLLLVASVTHDKQSRPYSFLLFVLNVVFSPLVLAIVVLAALLNAPILSLYTLPIFWLAFPRPSNFWPQQERGLNHVTADSVYYEEVVPNLVKILNYTLSTGVLGNVRPGQHFLLRYESRFIWLSVLECGFGYLRVILKGLELQTTSCHTLEATAVDTILDWAFETEGGKMCQTSQTPLHVLSPKTYSLIETYVDSRNVLTGVLDSPDTLKVISTYFPKCLIWVLLNHATKNQQLNKVEQPKKRSVESEKNPEPFKQQNFRPASTSTNEILLADGNDELEDDPWKDEQDVLGSPQEEWEKLPSIDLKYFSFMTKETNVPESELQNISSSDNDVNITESDCLQFGSQPCDVQPLKSNFALTGREMQHVDDFLPFGPAFQPLGNVLPTPSYDAHHTGNGFQPSKNEFHVTESDFLQSGNKLHQTESDTQLTGIGFQRLDSELSVVGNEFQQPESEPYLPGSVEEPTLRTFQDVRKIVIAEVVEKSVNFLEEVCDEDDCSCLPEEWLDEPLGREVLKSIESEFPRKWLGLVWRERGVVGGKNELRGLQRVVLSCHYIVNQLSVVGTRVAYAIHPSAVNSIFQGKLPWSAMSDWLTQNTTLFHLVITAFRYAVKVALDHVLLHDVESDADLLSRLQEYDRLWIIAPKTDACWAEGIRKHVPNLFSISFDSERYTYSSHLLTRRELPIYIGSLNRDAVHTIWSTLNLELLYLANDDEERYSIQAHESILRNLTVQAADPPLGYPIYVSEPLLIKVVPTTILQCQ